MNDRPQAGSAIDSEILLMQNRRFAEDDNKGVGEPLNEVDGKFNGYQIDAKYYM